MPSKGRKLRSLLVRNESAAIAAASRNAAVCLTLCPIELKNDVGCDLVPYFQYPVYENLIQPEAWLGLRDEAEVPAMFGDQQVKVGITGKGGVIEHGERDEGIILGLYDQSGHPDPVQELVGRLRGVVIVGAAEAKGVGREAVVKFVDVVQSIQAAQVEEAWREPLFRSDALLQAPDKTSGVDNVGWLIELTDAGRQIDGR